MSTSFKNLYTYNDLAAMLRTTPNVLRVAVHRGQIQSHRIGGRVFFTEGDIEAALRPNPTGSRKRGKQS
jgi:hypothetical protein